MHQPQKTRPVLRGAHIVRPGLAEDAPSPSELIMTLDNYYSSPDRRLLPQSFPASLLLGATGPYYVHRPNKLDTAL